MINNIKNNTVSEADTKKKINKLNEIKKVETIDKRLIDSQKILLKLFDDLVKAISNNGNNKIVNEDNNINANHNVNDNDRDDDYDSDYDDKNTVKQIDNSFKKIDETRSFEDQIDILKKNTMVKWLLVYGLLWR